MRRSKLYSVTLGLLLVPTGAFAGVVAPGQTTSNLSADLLLPSGSPISEKTVPFSINYGQPVPAAGFSGQLAGSFHSAVYQEAGGLTFLYSISLSPEDGVSGAGEASLLQVASFKSFTTHVTGALQFEDVVQVSRSLDGVKVKVASDTPGLGGAPTLLIHTDAAKFANTGSASFLASDEVPDQFGDSRLASGQASFTGVPQPINDSTGGPTAIPLPPAAYSGLALLAVMAAVGISRKRQFRMI